MGVNNPLDFGVTSNGAIDRMNLTSPKQSAIAFVVHRHPLPAAAWQYSVKLRIRRTRPNWSLAFGLAVLGLFSCVCWAGIAHVISRWVR